MGLAKKVGIGIGIVFAIFITMGVVAVMTSPSLLEENNGSGEASESIKETEIQPARTFTDSDFKILYAEPKAHKGSSVDITGKIFKGSEKEGNLIAFQMWQGGKASLDRNTVIYYEGSDPTEFVADDCVRVIGVSGKELEGTNPFGGIVIAPTINADSVEELDCIDVLYPAKKVVNLGSTQTQDEIKLTMEKVEFADEHTRVYLNVENANTESEIYFSTSGVVAFQGNKQFETTYAFDVDFPEIEYEIYPGILEEGVILFEPLDYTLSEARFQFEVRGESFLDEFKFIFDVAIPQA